MTLKVIILGTPDIGDPFKGTGIFLVGEIQSVRVLDMRKSLGFWFWSRRGRVAKNVDCL